MEPRVCDVYEDEQEFVRLLSAAAQCAETPCEKDFVASMVSRFGGYGALARMTYAEIEYLERIAYSDS